MLSKVDEDIAFFFIYAAEGTSGFGGKFDYSKATNFQLDWGENIFWSYGNLLGSYIRFFISSKKSTLCAIYISWYLYLFLLLTSFTYTS